MQCFLVLLKIEMSIINYEVPILVEVRVDYCVGIDLLVLSVRAGIVSWKWISS